MARSDLGRAKELAGEHRAAGRDRHAATELRKAGRQQRGAIHSMLVCGMVHGLPVHVGQRCRPAAVLVVGWWGFSHLHIFTDEGGLQQPLQLANVVDRVKTRTTIVATMVVAAALLRHARRVLRGHPVQVAGFAQGGQTARGALLVGQRQ